MGNQNNKNQHPSKNPTPTAQPGTEKNKENLTRKPGGQGGAGKSNQGPVRK